MSELTSHLYNDSDLLWQAIEEQLDQRTILVVPNSLVRQRLLITRAEPTVWDRRIRTVFDIRQKINETGAGLAPVLLPLEMSTQMRELLDDPALPVELSRLKDYPAGLDQLVKHLATIDERADRRYQPTNRIEEGIDYLRSQLKNSGYISGATFSSEIARQAGDFRLDGVDRIIALVAGQLDPMLSGLFKGLSEQHEVSLYMLSTKSTYPLLLKQSLIDLLPCQTEFVDRSETEIKWIATPNEAETILDIAAAYLDQGIEAKEIGIISSADPRLWDQLEQEAARRNLPLAIRTQVTSYTSALGTLLLSLVDHWQQGDLDKDKLHVKAGQTFKIDLAQRQQLNDSLNKASSFNQQLEVISTFGQRVLEKSDPLVTSRELDQEWLAGLQYFIRDHKLNQGDLKTIISETRGEQRLRGPENGIMVISYNEAGAYSFRKGIYASLSLGNYPRLNRRSAFTSEQLLQKVPRLRDPELISEFSAALMASKEEVALVRASNRDDGNIEGASPYWLRAIEMFDQQQRFAEINLFNDNNLPAPPQKSSTKRQLQHSAREQISLDQIDQLLPQTSRQGLPQGIFQGERQTYSVTELELFLDCPLGWFVRHVLKPSQRPSERAQLGQLAHRILAKTIYLQGSERDQEIELLIDQADLSEHNNALMKLRLQEIVAKYSDPNWPLKVIDTEIDLDTDGLLPRHNSYTIKGRADRIDHNQYGQPLVVDYKLGKRPGSKGSGKQLQQILYPLMAAAKYQADPLGLVYVSIRFVDHDGLLTESINGVDNDNISYRWVEERDRGLDQIDEAIAAIEEGFVLRPGRSCSEWCPHRLISETTLKLEK